MRALGKEGRDVEWEIFETFKCVVTMGEGFKKTLRGLQRHFSPLAPTFVIINDYKEEE